MSDVHPRTRRGKFFLFLSGIVVALGIATASWALMTSHGQGTGSLTVDTLSAPTNVVATFPDPDVRTVQVTWTAATGLHGVSPKGYYVQRWYLGTVASPACGTSPTSLITTSTCDDTGVASNTYTYTVTAVYNTWSATSSASGTVVVPASQLSSFAVSPSTSTPTAGAAFSVALTAIDQYGNTDTNYSGPENVVFSGAADSPSSAAPTYPTSFPFASGSSVDFVNGVATGTDAASLTLYDAQSVTLTATDSSTGSTGSASLTVSAAAASSFTVADPGDQTAGSPFSDTISAFDQYGNAATSYSGAQSMAFSGPSNDPNGDSPSYPATVNFTSGVGTAPGITLVDAERTALVATQGSITGTSASFEVSAAAASSFTVADPGDQTAGSPFGDTITALDRYGNTATGYNGAHSMAFSGPSDDPNGDSPTYPATVNFTSGVGTASGITLVDAERTPLVATEGSITGASAGFEVDAAAANTFALASPGDQTAGSPFGDTITAFDQFGNTATGYSGAHSIAFSGPSNDPDGDSPSYPATVTFTSGVGTASGVTLVDAERTALVATEGSITGASASFEVSSAAANTFALANPGDQAAGSPFGDTVTALDRYGNTATGYTGVHSVAFSGPSDDPDGDSPTYPATVNFTSGVGTASGITLVDAERTALVATEGSITGASGEFRVDPLAAGTFALANPGDQTAGNPFGETVTALDQYGNTATGYSGAHSIAFSGPSDDPNGDSPTYPATVTFTSGVGTASITLVDAERTALVATEGSITGTSADFMVGAAPVAGLELADITANTLPVVTCAGPVGSVNCSSTGEGSLDPVSTMFSASLQIEDQYGNVATNTGSPITVDLATTGDGAVTPDGPNVLSIPDGSSTTSASFALDFDNENSNSVTMTATIDGQDQTLSVTLSS